MSDTMIDVVPNVVLTLPELSNSRFATGEIAWSFIRRAAELIDNGAPIDAIDLANVRHVKPYILTVCTGLVRELGLGPSFRIIEPIAEDAKDHVRRSGLYRIIQPSDGTEIENEARDITQAPFI